MEIMSVISRMAYIGRVVANTGYDIFYFEETQEDKYRTGISYGLEELGRVKGLSLDHLPLRAAKGYSKLKGRKNMYTVWSCMSEEVCFNTKLNAIQDYSSLQTNPVETMNRRWVGSSISNFLKSCRDNANGISVEEVASHVLRTMRVGGYPIELGKSVIMDVLDVLKYIGSNIKCFKPVSFMSEQSYQRFMEDGHTKT